VNASHLLAEAADLIRLAATASRSSLDEDQADRLDRLATSLDGETDYRRNIEHGHAPVRRRTDAPEGAALGWWLAYDAMTRLRRAELDRSPTLEADEQAA
jgi:hypothetical protein